MNDRHWVRIVCIAMLALAVSCGGSGDDEWDGGDLPGDFWTAVDIATAPCGPPVNEVMGGNITLLAENRIRVDVFVTQSGNCGVQMLTLYGTRTGPSSADMDDVAGEFLCALELDYGYGIFSIANAVMTEIRAGVYQIQGDFNAEYGSGVCSGTIWITLDGN